MVYKEIFPATEMCCFGSSFYIARISYLSFSVIYFSTPRGYARTKKVLHTFGRMLRIDSVDETWKRNSVPDMLKLADPGDDSLQSHSESRMWNTSKLAKI
jgi:hypothetical protein